MTGIVFDIQRFSIHDGPGIRTTVFLKGCSNACAWCHNPESLRRGAEIQVYPHKCIACGACVAACRERAHELTDEGKVYHRERCTVCGECVQECFSGALMLAGRSMTVEEVAEEVAKDRIHYDQSHGGVTLSGGEPVLQREFAQGVLRACGESGIHTAIETAGNYPWSYLEALLPHVDLVMYDLKAWDPEIHAHYIGNRGERIRENLRRLAETDMPFIVRTPVVGGVNDSLEEIGAIARFLAGFPHLCYYELLPYHKLAASKYESLNRDYTNDLSTPTKGKMEELAATARLYLPDVRT